MCTSHNCEHKLTKQAVAEDRSVWALNRLLAAGYTRVTWRHAGAACDFCAQLDGMRWSLKVFIADLQYDAAIYEMSHCGCRCFLEVTGPKRKNLPVVMVGADG